MGYGGYSGDAHRAITDSRAHSTPRQVFEQTGRGVHKLLSPMNLGIRESRDSAIHPNSLAIAVVVDVTGSMGKVPETMALKTLPTLMEGILDQGVQDPQLMFIAIDDAVCGSRAPLQVGQFESAAQNMDQYLTNIDIVGGGGGNGGESYDLAAYTLARHTSTDCYEKRGKKGYAFFSGDDANFPRVSADIVRRVLGDDLREDIPVADIYRELQEKYHVFYIVPVGHSQEANASWRLLLGDHVIPMQGTVGRRSSSEDIDREDDTCTVIATVIALNEGRKTLTEIADAYAAGGMSQDRVSNLVRTLTPFAATLQRDGVPQPKVSEPVLPVHETGVQATGTPRQRRSARASA